MNDLAAQIREVCAERISDLPTNWQTQADILNACTTWIDPNGKSALASSWSWYLDHGVTPTLVAGSVWLAYQGYKQNRELATKRATLDIIETKEAAESFIIGKRTFLKYAARDPRSLAVLTHRNLPRHERVAVVDYLNHFETLAAGVHEGILSESHIRRVLIAVMKKAWHERVFFIHQYRYLRDSETGQLLKDSEGNPIYDPEYFEEFENLVRPMGLNPHLIPPKDGNWQFDMRAMREEAPKDFETLLLSMKIRPPDDETQDADFEKLINDLHRLSRPCEPSDLREISCQQAWQPDGDHEIPKVMDDAMFEPEEDVISVEDHLAQLAKTLDEISGTLADWPKQG